MTMVLDKLLQQARDVLKQQGLSWALLGGWAVSIRTEPRFTRDVDLAVAVDSDRQAESIIRAFRSARFEVAALVEQDAVHRLATVRLVPGHGEKGILLDLLFASSGIEREICIQAEPLEILPGLIVPVAKAEHLLALKILARDDRTRPQDAGDIRALLQVVNASGLDAARDALRLVTSRGYNRGRDLMEAMDSAERDHREFVKPHAGH